VSGADFPLDAILHLDLVGRATTTTTMIPVPLGPGERSPAVAVWAKLEFQLPSGSTKDRIAAHILRNAIADGWVTPSTTVIEASSGSTSISFAMLCARLGIPFVAVMPEGVSRERLRIIEEFGGTWELTPTSDGVPGSIAVVRERAKEPDVFWPDQFDNPRNTRAHELVTGPQLIDQMQSQAGRLPAGFVAAVGTAGTLMGIGRALRRQAEGAVIARVRVGDAPFDAEQGCVTAPERRGAGEPPERRGAGEPPERRGAEPPERRGAEPPGIPGVVDCLSGLLDPDEFGLGEDIVIEHAEAMTATRELRHLGFPVGPSSGLNFAGARVLARRLGPGQPVATVFCDRMERYFSIEPS
jgi:cysteine synthase A